MSYAYENNRYKTHGPVVNHGFHVLQYDDIAINQLERSHNMPSTQTTIYSNLRLVQNKNTLMFKYGRHMFLM